MQMSLGEMDGDQWEKWCQKLLRSKYEDYQEVPAQFGGDLGIEGFTRSGIVFQCYCPDENPAGKDLYDKQRDKITADIKKLIKNASQIQALGTGTIQGWHFLTPQFNSRHLHDHCREKEKRVRSANAVVFDPGFEIYIRTEDDYIPEREALLGIGAHRVQPSHAEPDSHAVADFINADNDIIGNIRRKLSNLQIPQEKQSILVGQISKNYMVGQQELETLYQGYPDTFQSIALMKESKEAQLQVESLMSTKSPGVLLQSILTSYENDLSDNYASKLGGSLIKRLSSEAIADWLGRCPLDFYSNSEVEDD
jgi:hypothetical protein